VSVDKSTSVDSPQTEEARAIFANELRHGLSNPDFREASHKVRGLTPYGPRSLAMDVRGPSPYLLAGVALALTEASLPSPLLRNSFLSRFPPALNIYVTCNLARLGKGTFTGRIMAWRR
jgi:hypothetical protein